MQNRTDANAMEFTMLGEKYLGYRIEWATTPSQDQPTKWLGHFHAFKDSHPTVRGSLVNPQSSAGDAHMQIIRVARVRIEETILRQDRLRPLI